MRSISLPLLNREIGDDGGGGGGGGGGCGDAHL